MAHRNDLRHELAHRWCYYSPGTATILPRRRNYPDSPMLLFQGAGTIHQGCCRNFCCAKKTICHRRCHSLGARGHRITACCAVLQQSMAVSICRTIFDEIDNPERSIVYGNAGPAPWAAQRCASMACFTIIQNELLVETAHTHKAKTIKYDTCGI